jgi:hypothetical protein
MSAGIPKELEPEFQQLHNDLVGLCGRWQMFKQLFTSGQARLDVLAQMAPAFFGLMHTVLLEDVLSGIARITDKPKTFKDENLVLRQLLDGLAQATHGALHTQLSSKLATADSACEPIRKIRHKILSHRDYNTALDPKANPLPQITSKTVEDALAAIADFMNSFQQPFTGSVIGYMDTITGLGDAEGLVRHLRRAYEHIQLQKQGKVSRVGELSPQFEGL